MVGANYTGGRRNAAKVRSKDSTGRLQRGHFSKQRLGILTDALRSRRPDHPSHSRPPPAPDNPNLTANPPSLSLISPSGYSTCTPVATVYDISLGHAKRDLAQKQLRRRLSTQQDFHLHRNDNASFSSSLQLGQPHPHQPVSDALPAATSLESSTPHSLSGNAEPDPAFSPQPSLPVTTSSVGQPCATSPSHSTPLPENQSTPVTEIPPKRHSRILDLLDASDRKHLCLDSCLPHSLCQT